MNATEHIRKLQMCFDRTLCAVFPRRCIYCGQVIVPERRICADCEANLPCIAAPICPLCGHAKADCTCKQKKHKFKAICAPFYYEDAIVQAVHRLKFENKDFLAIPFAADMAECVRREYADLAFDAVTFVPFTKRQMRLREWNPSERLAEALAEQLNLPLEPLLVKLYETKTQHTLESRARTGNVFGVFDTADPHAVAGKTILLVDDIKTTGATLNECAKMLMLADAEAVYACTFAVTKRKGGDGKNQPRKIDILAGV